MTMTAPAAELTLPDVAREFPTWACWQAISGMYLARHRDVLPDAGCEIRGYDPRDLRHQITRAEVLGIRR
jgi:hypothetical protein